MEKDLPAFLWRVAEARPQGGGSLAKPFPSPGKGSPKQRGRE
jgi:hypothetical protein